jgi:hypothetical protein
VRQVAGDPQIRRWAGKYLRLVGRQIGGPGNRARVRIDVRVRKFDTQALERDPRYEEQDLDALLCDLDSRQP